MPMCAIAHQSLQEMTNTMRTSGEQHKELDASRTSRDWKDTGIVSAILKERNPFEYGDAFCNIATRVHARPCVNVDDAKTIGQNILDKMIGVKMSEFFFKRKDHAIPLATKSSAKVVGESMQKKSQALFQRLVLVACSA